MTFGKAVVHQFYDCLRWVGLRDRLRCPQCKAVGTWKPHGGLLDFEDVRKIRRWLCKWCGYYLGPEGELLCFPDARKRCWSLPRSISGESKEETHFMPRPDEAIMQFYFKFRSGHLGVYVPNPWRG